MPRSWVVRAARVDPLRWTPKWARARATTLAVVVSVVILGGLVVQELLLHGTEFRAWDMLLLSGYLTVIVALWLVSGQRYRFVSMVQQLHANRTLRLDGVEVHDQQSARDDLLRESDAEALVWSNLGGLLLASLMIVAWPAATIERHALLSVIGGAALAGAAAYLVGRQAATLAYYGYWALSLPERVKVAPQPGHPDGAAGLRPLGAYYFSQAYLLAIPGGFLLVWTLLIPFWDGGRYLDWRPWYQGFLALALATEALAFFAPLIGVHHRMQARKHELLGGRAGELSLDIERVRRQLEGDLQATERTNLRAQLDELTSAYHDIEQMPTWPIDQTIRTRFTVNYAVMALPLLGQWLDGNGSWESLAERLVQ